MVVDDAYWRLQRIRDRTEFFGLGNTDIILQQIKAEREKLDIREKEVMEEIRLRDIEQAELEKFLAYAASIGIKPKHQKDE